MIEYLNATVIEGLIIFSVGCYMASIGYGLIHREAVEKNNSLGRVARYGFPVVFLTAIVFIFRGLFITSVDMVESFAFGFTREINKISPMMIDDETKLLGATSTGKVVNVRYSFTTLNREDVDSEQLKENARRALNSQFCSASDVIYNLNNGMGINIVYTDKNNVEVTRFWINRQSCEGNNL